MVDVVAARRAALLVVMLAAGASACLDDVGVVCDDGTTCPDKTTCALIEGVVRCSTAGELAACDQRADGDACDVAGETRVCHAGVCVPIGCGDGFVSGAEQCDLGNLGARATCDELGYYRAEPLRCDLATCGYDLAACATAGTCGDGVLDEAAGEQCDGTPPADKDTCAEVGGDFYYDGDDAVTCSPSCRLDLSACDQYCGNGTIDGDEPCDGDARAATQDTTLDGEVDCRDFAASVAGLPYYAGQVSCTPLCSIELDACEGSCGNNVIDLDGWGHPREFCDGDDLPAGETCRRYGYWFGTPGCTADCSATIITPPPGDAGLYCFETCGDGHRGGGEICDGFDVPGGFSCEAAGYYEGFLGCSVGCNEIDYSSCGGYCGDGVVDAAGDEACDGAAQGDSPVGEGCSPYDGNGAIGCNRFCQPAFAACQDRRWTNEVLTLDPGLLAQLTFVGGYAASPADVWLIGQNAAGSLVVHYDGDDWRVVVQGWPRLTAIAGRGDAVWIGDAFGNLYARAGETLMAVTAPGGAPIQALAVTDDDLLLAAAGGFLYTRPSGASWGIVNAFTGVRGVTAHAADAVVWNASQAWRRAGATWAPAPTPGIDLRAAQILSPDLVWLVGSDGGAPAVRQWRVTADALDVIAVPATGGATEELRAVVGASLADLWLLGVRTSDAPVTAHVYHAVDGVVVADEDVAAPGGDGAGLVASHGGDLWLFGAEPRVGHYDGAGWRARGAVGTEPVLDAVVTPTSTWIVTPTRVQQLFQRTTTGAGVAWVDRELAPGDGRVVAARDVDDVWVFRDGGDGSSRMRRFTPGPSGEGFVPGHVVRDAWGGGGQLLAVSDDALLAFDLATGWTVRHGGLGLGPDAAMWVAGDDVWMVGASGLWREGAAAAAPLPAAFTASAVWATPGGDVWLAGQGVEGDSARGAIWRYDASRVDGAAGTRLTDAWLAQELPPSTRGLRAIWGRHPGDVWAAGLAGELLHWDGAAWARVVHREGTPGRDLLALHGLGGATASSALAALGGAGTVLQLDHVLPAIAGGVAVDAAPLYTSAAPTVRRLALPAGGEPTWLRLLAPRDGIVHLAVDAAGAGLTTVGLAMYLADANGLPMGLMAGAGGDQLDVFIDGGTTYYLAVSGSRADGADGLPLDLQTSFDRE